MTALASPDTLDREGRIISVSASNGGTASYGYNADDQPVTATLPGGLSANMSYDPNSQLTNWSYLGPSTDVTTTTVSLGYNYSYDAAERTSGITVTDNNVASARPITHDAASRLTGWDGPTGRETWAYDGNGNFTGSTMQNNMFCATEHAGPANRLRCITTRLARQGTARGNAPWPA